MYKKKDYTKIDAWKRGQDVETNRFKRVFSIIDPDIKPATKEEQFKHIDWHSVIGTIDVKAMKRVTRNSELQTEYIWIEFMNIAGYDGWLYGKQDWVAFEQVNGFLFVRRGRLAKLANSLCDLTQKVSKAGDALYKSYTRKDAEDVISMIKYSDLDCLPSFFVEDVFEEEDSSLFL